jgi:hypothetical protein
MRTRRLPVWIAGGPVVSELAYKVVAEAWGAYGVVANSWAGVPTYPNLDERMSTVELVERLAIRLDADEGDVLRAFAELERAGVLVKGES